MLRKERLLMVMMLLAAPAAAQTPPVTPTPPDFPRGKISGYIFGDYYYNAVGDPTHHYNAAASDSDKTNIDSSIGKQIGKDLNGVQIRRVYFQLDNDLSIKYSTRLRLEIDRFIAQPPQRELADSDVERLREKVDRVRELMEASAY